MQNKTSHTYSNTLKWISMSSSVKYDLTKLICEFMNLRTLLITNELLVQNVIFVDQNTQNSCLLQICTKKNVWCHSKNN